MIDAQLLIIAAIVVILIVAAISSFLIFGNRERSFEDALAERKGLNILLGDASHATSKKQGTKDVRKKKVSSGQQQSRLLPKTEVAAEDIALDETPTEPIVSDNQSTPIVQEDQVIEKSQELKQRKVHPKKDKVEEIQCQVDQGLVKNESADHGKDVTDSKQTLARTTETQVLQQNDESVTEASDVSPEQNAAQKKKVKKPKLTTAPKEVQQEILKSEIRSVEAMAPPVRETYQQGAETSAESDYNPAVVFRLRKELQEKEALVHQLNDKASLATKTVKDLKHDLFNEQQKQSQLERSVADQMNTLRAENHGLNQKMRDFQNQLTAKMQACRQMESQLMQCRVDQGHAAQAQQLREENNRLKERLGSIEQEILSRNGEVQLLKQDLLSHDAQVHRAEQQRQEIEQMRAIQEATLTQQMMEIQKKLVMKDSECGQLAEELNKLRNEVGLMEQDHSMLRQQLNEKEQHVETLAHQTTAENQSQKEMERIHNTMQETLKTLESELNQQRKINEDLIKSCQLKLQESNQQSEAKDNEIASLLKQVESVHEQTSKASNERFTEESARQQEIKNVVNDKNRLEDELNHLKDQLLTIQTKLHEKELANERLSDEVNVLKVEMTKSAVQDIKGLVVDDACSQNGGLQLRYNPDDDETCEIGASSPLEDCKTPIHMAFEWFQDAPPAHSVYVMGSFNGWTDAVQLQPALPPAGELDPATGEPLPPVCYRTKVPLLPGRHEFKFIVDGHWCCSPRYEHFFRDGTENNVIHI